MSILIWFFAMAMFVPPNNIILKLFANSACQNQSNQQKWSELATRPFSSFCEVT